MGIDQSVSSVTASSTSTATKSSSVSSKSSSESTFKDEMTKVSKSESKNDDKKEVTDKKDDKVENKTASSNDKLSSDTDKEKTLNDNNPLNKNTNNNLLEADISMNQYSFSDINNMLTNDIQQMLENTSKIGDISSGSWLFGFASDTKSSMKISESDANFFLNLTQTNDVSMSNIVAQGQNLLNDGVDITKVKQNVEVSQTLLNALKEARETNQPLRIDFASNVSVILRVGRDGVLSAQFIPGDKVAEQYLKNNIEALKSSFDEKDLPYNELSYSNSSKEQNRKRREEKRQGE